jgi:hypothetical protein
MEGVFFVIPRFVRRGTVGRAFIQIMLITSNLLCKMHLSDAIRALHPSLLAEAMAAHRGDSL